MFSQVDMGDNEEEIVNLIKKQSWVNDSYMNLDPVGVFCL